MKNSLIDDLYLGIEGELIKKDGKYPVKVGFIGCGSHSFRNIFSALQYIPIDMVAVCDLNEAKAEMYKRKFGAIKAYTDYKKMVDECDLDAVFVVVGYAEDGTPQYLPVVSYLLKKNISVWFEKPPARNAQEIQELIKIESSTSAFAQVGFKKMFMPAVTKIKEIIHSEEFGKITSYTLRYPVDLPRDIRDIKSSSGRRFIDDFVHVASNLVTLLGLPDELTYRRTKSGSSIATLYHSKGDYVGSIHLCPGASEMCPLESLEIVGTNANIMLDNNISIKYYPPSKRLPYGTTTSFIPNNPNGASFYGPEFSLGQLYNKGSFILGYYHQLKHFVDCVASHKKTEIAGLDDALRVMRLYDSFAGKEQSVIQVNKDQREDVERSNDDVSKDPICPNCSGEMYLKDGWNYTCKKCGKMVAASEL